MTAALRLFPEPITATVRRANLRAQTRMNERTPTAHNKRPQKTPMVTLGNRRWRRRGRRNRKQWVIDWGRR